MSLPVWIDNLVAYSLQIATLVAVGTLLAYLFRMRVPRITLGYWQVLLLMCVFIFAFQGWRHPVYSLPVAQVAVSSVVATMEADIPPPPASFIPSSELIGWVLVVGMLGRLLWLCIGLLRLQSFRRNAQVLHGEGSLVRDMQSLTKTRSLVLVSDATDTPVTFGAQAPVIILPSRFGEMIEAHKRAVLCHELLHIRRRDWLFILGEETVRAVFWFHPAIWWVLSRIRLSREQAVDHEVVCLCGNRQPYLDSLLEFARNQRRSQAIPAPLFLKENHLVQRVALLLKEASMSRSRLFCSLSAMLVLLIGTVKLAAGWFPLTGEPIIQEHVSGFSGNVVPQRILAAKTDAKVLPPAVRLLPVAKSQPVMTAENVTPALPVETAAPVQQSPIPIGREPIRVGGGIQESKLIYRVDPVYPELAKRARITGRVVMAVTVNEDGLVTDVRVTNGHPLLAEAAISAVRQWRYSPTLLNGAPVPVMTTVTCVFNIRGDNDVVLQMDEYGSLTALPPGDMNALMQKMALGGTAVVNILSSTPIRVAERAVQDLIQKGVQKLEMGGAYAFYNGRLFYTGAPARPPQILPNTEVLQALLNSSPKDSRGLSMIQYNLYINEVGEILGIQRIAGPDNPAIEHELMRTRVLSPAFLGADPVPFVYALNMTM